MQDHKSSLSVDEIMRILPHRYPFLLVDRVISITEGPRTDTLVGRHIHVRKAVTYNEPYFVGHFPHRAVMPGVLQIEALAQAGALVAYRNGGAPTDVVIASIIYAKFRSPVVPGDVLEIFCEVKKDRKSMIVIEGRAEVDGRTVCEAEFMAKLF